MPGKEFEAQRLADETIEAGLADVLHILGQHVRGQGGQRGRGQPFVPAELLPQLQASQAGFECGVCLEQACDTKVFHNNVVSAAPPFSSIEWRFANTSAEITNNLASHTLRERDGATASLTGNLSSAPLSLFINGPNGDLHLVSTASLAIDQGVAIGSGMSTDDFDGGSRDATPDLGADEYLDLPYDLYLPLLLKES